MSNTRKKNSDYTGSTAEKATEVSEPKTPEASEDQEFAKVVSSLADATGIITDISEEAKKEEPSDTKKHSKHHELDDQVKEMLDSALDESADDLGITEEQTQASNVNLSQVLSAVFGLFVIIFAVYGIITAVINIKAYNEAKKSNASKIEYFERLILPLAASDAPTFEDISSLNNDVVLSAACWDIILSPSATQVPENGSYTISYLEVDARVNKLFGKGISYTHGTVGDEVFPFIYDESSGMYHIPAFPRAIAYVPKVEKMEAVSNGYKLSVSYKIPVTEWIAGSSYVEKIMVYTVTGNGLTYTISKLEVGEIVNTQDL